MNEHINDKTGGLVYYCRKCLQVLDLETLSKDAYSVDATGSYSHTPVCPEPDECTVCVVKPDNFFGDAFIDENPDGDPESLWTR